VPPTVDPEAVLERFYPRGSSLLALLRRHGRQVAAKALAVADRVAHLNPDRRFLYEAAMLHDVGILETDSPALGCCGNAPYVCHGVLGRRMLEAIGLARHALVCERHVGVGLSAREIRERALPLPLRDMRPLNLEEEIICYADKFFSKNGRGRETGRSVAEVVALLGPYGPQTVDRFRQWVQRFEAPDAS
jgi:uncharacterized protein